MDGGSRSDTPTPTVSSDQQYSQRSYRAENDRPIKLTVPFAGTAVQLLSKDHDQITLTFLRVLQLLVNLTPSAMRPVLLYRAYAEALMHDADTPPRLPG